MNSRSRFVSSLCLAAALTSSILLLLVAEHHYYRVYDPYYSDYHVWNGEEVGLLHTSGPTISSRSPSRLSKLPPEEQKEYWTWRHSHGEHH